MRATCCRRHRRTLAPTCMWWSLTSRESDCRSVPRARAQGWIPPLDREPCRRPLPPPSLRLRQRRRPSNRPHKTLHWMPPSTLSTPPMADSKGRGRTRITRNTRNPRKRVQRLLVQKPRRRAPPLPPLPPKPPRPPTSRSLPLRRFLPPPLPPSPPLPLPVRRQSRFATRPATCCARRRWRSTRWTPTRGGRRGRQHSWNATTARYTHWITCSRQGRSRHVSVGPTWIRTW
mmetsp:Transcript_7631/g.18897  ORF Transcript_7631/g.18897 Transcript_7631/m.18897 type:complete len:231 (+) Transcript_7631:1007-1699(+)